MIPIGVGYGMNKLTAVLIHQKCSVKRARCDGERFGLNDWPAKGADPIASAARSLQFCSRRAPLIAVIILGGDAIDRVD
jgi:hypothetical protein